MFSAYEQMISSSQCHSDLDRQWDSMIGSMIFKGLVSPTFTTVRQNLRGLWFQSAPKPSRFAPAMELRYVVEETSPMCRWIMSLKNIYSSEKLTGRSLFTCLRVSNSLNTMRHLSLLAFLLLSTAAFTFRVEQSSAHLEEAEDLDAAASAEKFVAKPSVCGSLKWYIDPWLPFYNCICNKRKCRFHFDTRGSIPCFTCAHRKIRTLPTLPIQGEETGRWFRQTLKRSGRMAMWTLKWKIGSSEELELLVNSACICLLFHVHDWNCG